MIVPALLFPPGEGFTKTGTYSQSGTTVTITITSHGVAVGDELTIDYTSGSAVDGTLLVASVTDYKCIYCYCCCKCYQ